MEPNPSNQNYILTSIAALGTAVLACVIREWIYHVTASASFEYRGAGLAAHKNAGSQSFSCEVFRG